MIKDKKWGSAASRPLTRRGRTSPMPTIQKCLELILPEKINIGRISRLRGIFFFCMQWATEPLLDHQSNFRSAALPSSSCRGRDSPLIGSEDKKIVVANDVTKGRPFLTECFGESLCANVTHGGERRRKKASTVRVADTDPIKCFWILPVAMGAFRNRTRERERTKKIDSRAGESAR